MYSANHVLITASGTLPGGEIWACGVRSMGFVLPQYLQGVSDAAAVAWRSWASGTGSGFSIDSTIDKVTTRVISVAGLSTDIAESAVPAGAGGGVSTNVPNQCTVVLSLLTGKPGRGNRGRMYLPTLSLSIGSKGRLNTGAAALMLGPAKKLIDDLNLALQVGPTSSDNRIGIQSKVGPHATQVTEVRMGDVVDTQRRRRDALVENYATASVNP